MRTEAWWAYLEQTIAELTVIFPERFFHGGADEFHPDCWLDSRKVLAWAVAENITTASCLLSSNCRHHTAAPQILDYFHTRWQTILFKANRRPMFWDEFFWTYDAPTPTRSNLTVLEGTTASVRGITGDAGAPYSVI